MTFHKSIELAGTMTVGPKGQVVIPAEYRDKMDIKPGDKIVGLYFEEKQSIAFVTEQQIQKFVDEMGAQFTQFKSTLDQRK